MNYLYAKRSIILKLLIVVILLASIPILNYLFAEREAFARIIDWVQHNQFTFLFSLWLVRTISIIYPPIPGVLISLASIPLVGWELAYLVDILGSFTGATIAFWLGKKYGLSLLRWLVGIKLVRKIEDIRLKSDNQVEAAFVMRIAAGGLLSDGLVWGASVIGFRYLPFITGYLISHLATSLPFFYIVTLPIDMQIWIIGVPVIIAAWGLIIYLRGRYFR